MNRRTVLVGCTGIVEQPGARIEGELYGLTSSDRVGRLIEWIALLKKLWTEDNVTFEGKHYRCTGVTIEPKPASKPRPPIWVANNAREDKPFAEWTAEDFALIERTHRRCARHADGWQTSAWDPKDLEFRINDTLKKAPRSASWASSINTPDGWIHLDINRHSVSMDGQLVSLTATEFRLLQYLMTNAGRVVPTAELLKGVWGLQGPPALDVVGVYAHRLGRKLEQDLARPHLLHTIPGVGVLPFPAWDPVDIERYRGKRALEPVSRWVVGAADQRA